MTYSSGGLIQATDYNTTATSINTLWGTGSGSSGYGQTNTLSALTGGTDIVSATQWSTMIARLQSMQQHQSNNTTGVPTAPSASQTVSVISTIATCLSTVTTNKNVTASYGTTVSATATTNSTNWSSASTKTFTYTFGSSDQARYFFNAGGYIQLTSNTNTIASPSSGTAWNTFVNTGFNNWTLSANTSQHNGTVGTYTRGTYLSAQGFYNLTSTPTTWLQLQETGTGNANYNANYITVNVSYSAAVLTVSFILTDGDTNTFGKTNTGTTTCTPSATPAWTTYLTSPSSPWGTVPTASNTVNTQA